MTIFIIVLAVFVLLFIAGVLYLKFGWFAFFYHDVLGWCEPDKSAEYKYDGCSLHATCRHCGKDIMQDSQGNWF